MPFSKLKRTHKYDVSVKNALLVVVELLDQREMECSVANDSSAQECVNIVLNRLQVHAEGFYFGLQYLNKQKHRYRWLELDKSLKKQLDKAGSVSSHVLRFGVMYYIPNISKLQTKQARHLYFLQVRKLITENSFNCSLDAICVLASYSLQAEFGDFNPAVHNVRFLQNYPVFPSKLYGNAPDELFEKVLKLYKERHGLSGDQAELCYMTEAQQIEDYGVEYVEAKMDRTKEDVSIGTSSVGLVLRFRPQSSETGTHSGVDADTVENKQMISWSKIHQMNYKDTSFLVVRLDKSEMKFTVKSNEECRYLWVRSIGNHQIYRQSRKLSLAAASSSGQEVNLGQKPVATVVSSEVTVSPSGKPERQFQKNDAITASPRHIPKHGVPKSNTLGAFGRQDSSITLSPKSSTLPMADKAVESPFSLRYSYPMGDDKSSSNDTSGPRSVTNSSSLNESGAYDQLSFTSTMRVNSENRNEKTNENDETMKSQQPKKQIPSYDHFMANRPLFQQRTQLDYGSMNALYENHNRLLVSSYPNISTSEYPQFFGGHYINARDYGRRTPPRHVIQHDRHSSVNNPLNVDSNRYNYFDNLAALGEEQREGERREITMGGCLHCGAHSAGVQQSTVNRNTSLSFSRNREEHSSSMSPHESPLHHAVSSPELNINGNCPCQGHVFSNGPTSRGAHGYDQERNRPGSEQLRRPSCQHCNRQTEATSPAREYRNTHQEDPMLQQTHFHPQPMYSNFYSKKMFISTPELYHGHSVSNVESTVAAAAANNNGDERGGGYDQGVRKRHSAALTSNQRYLMTYRKQSEPLPPVAWHGNGRSHRPNAMAPSEHHQPTMGNLSSNARPVSPQLVSHKSFENLADTAEVQFAESVDKTPRSSFNQQPTDYHTAPVQVISSHQKLSVAGNNANNSTWSISPLAKFKSTDQLDRFSDYDGDTHPYSDPERLELRRNNPAFQGDTRRSYMERKLIEGSLRHEFGAVQVMKSTAKFSVAKMSENYNRNRFSECLPYDDTRVKLSPCRELNNHVGYINASWIKTKIAGTTFRYISTQNPLDGTCVDFWQMVWEKQAALIVMMSPQTPGQDPHPHPTNGQWEGDNDTEHTMDTQSSYCARYKPYKAGETVEFGYISVKAENVQLTEYCIATTLKLNNRREMESRVVWHLQFLELPLLLPPKPPSQSPNKAKLQHLSSPDLISKFIRFLNEVRSIRQHLREEGIDSLPLVVHCATGSGGSGAFMLSEIMLTLIEHEEVIDVQRVLTFLRYQRPAMVDNYLYYEFVYRVLIQSLALVRLI